MEQRPEQTQEITAEQLSELLQIRRDKLSALVAEGKDPFAVIRYDQTEHSTDIQADFDAYENKEVSIAGRMMSKRIMGKASFAHVLDGKGDIQIYVKRDDVGEEAYAGFKTWDIGDIIGVKGFVFKTKTGEISVHANEITLLSKSLRPLPEKFHGLKDPELRYRQRYVDLFMNDTVRETFRKRSAIIAQIRRYLDESRLQDRRCKIIYIPYLFPPTCQMQVLFFSTYIQQGMAACWHSSYYRLFLHMMCT